MRAEAASSLREQDGFRHILLVEHNLVDPKAITGLLRNAGYCVEAVGNGRDALAALEDRRFDIVLMDIQAPEMDGIRTIAAIRGGREKVTGAHLPIVGVTSHALEQEREGRLPAGTDACVSEPIQLAELLQTIERLTKPDLEDSRQSVRPAQQTPTVDAYALTESRRLLAEIQAAIRAGDVKTIRQTADALKACITAALAKEAFEAASMLEKTLHEDDLARAQDACRRLRDTINSLNPTHAGKNGRPVESRQVSTLP
jgi:two-component system, sensor histidine kinase and response regulator